MDTKRLVAVFLVVAMIIIVPTGCTVHKRNCILAAIEAGVDPITAKVVFESDDAENSAVHSLAASRALSNNNE